VLNGRKGVKASMKSWLKLCPFAKIDKLVA